MRTLFLCNSRDLLPLKATLVLSLCGGPPKKTAKMRRVRRRKGSLFSRSFFSLTLAPLSSFFLLSWKSQLAHPAKKGLAGCVCSKLHIAETAIILTSLGEGREGRGKGEIQRQQKAFCGVSCSLAYLELISKYHPRPAPPSRVAAAGKVEPSLFEEGFWGKRGSSSSSKRWAIIIRTRCGLWHRVHKAWP